MLTVGSNHERISCVENQNHSVRHSKLYERHNRKKKPQVSALEQLQATIERMRARDCSKEIQDGKAELKALTKAAANGGRLTSEDSGKNGTYKLS